MPELRELQERFSTNLFDAEATDVLRHVYAGTFDADQRTQIYRNNVITGFTESLRAIYPVVERLVGEGFFRYAANEYIQQFPSTSGNLHAYGDKFAFFLNSFEPAQELKYLPDVARMEWQYHEVYHEADAERLDINVLSHIDPALYPSLRFKLNPASRLMRSDYPILQVWRVNQDSYTGDQSVDLSTGGVRLLVLRNEEEVEFHPLAEPEYQMLEQISHHRKLGECVDAVLSIDDDFDLHEFFTKFAGNKTLVGFLAT